MKEYRYENEQLIVHWYPELCSHPGICLKTLPQVFDVNKSPWININAAEPEEIISCIDKCPSGALRYSLPEGSRVNPHKATGVGSLNYEQANPAIVKIRVVANGPLLIEGPAVAINFDGKTLKEGAKMVLCRCGLSANRPFCDGEHRKQGWQVDQK